MMDILVPGNSQALLISSELLTLVMDGKGLLFSFGVRAKGVDALRNKGAIKQTFENIQYSPNKRRFIEFWFVFVFFFTGYEQVSFSFLASWSVVEL